MALNLSFLKRLIAEDFNKSDQQLIGKLGSIINPALEAITNALNKGLTINDLNMQTKSLTIQVDALGVPTTAALFKSELNGRCNNLWVSRAQNISNNTLLTSAPFINYSENNGLITITQVLGLPVGTKWLITLVAAV